MKNRLRNFMFEIKLGSSHINMTGENLIRCFHVSPWTLKEVYKSSDTSLRLLNYKQLVVDYCGNSSVYTRKQPNYPLTILDNVLYDGDTILYPWEVFEFENVTVKETDLNPADLDESFLPDCTGTVYLLKTPDFECYCINDEILRQKNLKK